MTAPAARWPLHPVPGPIESLSSWLDRIATAHGIDVRTLVANLDLDTDASVLYDYIPGAEMLDALHVRTGVAVDRLRTMVRVTTVSEVACTRPAQAGRDRAEDFGN